MGSLSEGVFDTLRSRKVQSHISASRFFNARRRKNVSFSRCDPCLKVCFDTLRYLMVQRHILAGVGGLRPSLVRRDDIYERAIVQRYEVV